jgi:two-component system, LuxR family, response regulator FixJ
MSNQIPKHTVFIVDDDDAVRDSLDMFLTMRGMNVAAFSSGKAMFASDKIEPDLVVLDVNMPESDGFAVLLELRARRCAAPVILISGLGDSELRSRSERAGVVAFFDKPIDTLALCQKITTILQDRSTAAT